jgi:hypothetical protein
MRETSNACRHFVEKSLGRRAVGKPRRRWEPNVKVDFMRIGCEDGTWLELAQDLAHWRALILALFNLWTALSIFFNFKIFHPV